MNWDHVTTLLPLVAQLLFFTAFRLFSFAPLPSTTMSCLSANLSFLYPNVLLSHLFTLSLSVSVYLSVSDSLSLTLSL